MDDRGLITVGVRRDVEPPPVAHGFDELHLGRVGSPSAEGTVCGAWQTVKEVVHAYARDPSQANALQVASAFQALREQQERSRAVARWRGVS